MALLKFICDDCKNVFEELTTSDKKPSCPQCGSKNVQRCYQGKCYFGGGKGSGGSCSGGSCSCCKGCS